MWSVSKPPTAETPKPIRILKRGDNVEPGVNWLAWSKNGRVIQYQDGYVQIFSIMLSYHVLNEDFPQRMLVMGCENQADFV